MPQSDALDHFLPPVAAWFRESFGDPTPPQAQGWPSIASGRNTLIFSPTGSGKTLAAFLACLDHLWKTPRTAKGVRILYVSPLKALNHDISRNLRVPLEGILATSERIGPALKPLAVGVRTGDTPSSERQKMVRRPPDILITTPESLHLLLTSNARETLRTVSHVIVDEIHALCPNKRGVFLAILLERLEAIAPGFVRVGLSATQKPLEEVARYLGGLKKVGPDRFEGRPVSIVDAGRRKQMDLEVSWPSRGMGPQPAGSIWPAIEARLLQAIREHRSTIVFANNRRVVERLTAHLNELAESEGADAPVARSHHGSLSLEARRQTEELLKDGELPAVIATASLEMGIDMGAVDLVCQVESPGGVARGLQRVGRAGHLVGRTSKGRLFAKTAGDLVEAAALAGAMMAGDVETLRVPSNCLDVLAQQVVACVAVDRWTVPALFDLIRGAYPYRDLTPNALEGVLRMTSGRFAVEALRDLKPRISWDRVHNTLRALPGSKHLAVVGGGTIPDTGQYPLYLGDGGPRLGELDEEFVLERRVGETFVLGTSTWQITAIEPHRVVVAAAGGRSALMPFWRGENAGRTAELGRAVGALCREVAARRDQPGVLDWLRSTYCLDPPAAEALAGVISRQMRQAGAVPDDRTILVESFKDPTGELGLAVLTPRGHKLHHALKLVLTARLRDRLGIEVAALHDDDGILFRLPGMDDPPMDLFAGLTSDLAAGIVRDELSESALFGLRFRQNAGRALLMPRPDPGKRAPLWLQRLRAKDLLQAVRKFPDFPIVVETYRECLDEDLDLPRLRGLLDDVASGRVRVVTRSGEIPSPFTSELVFRFTLKYLYEWDDPVRGDRRPGPIVADEALDPLLDPSSRRMWLEPEAIRRVEGRLRGAGHPPRSVDEMAEWLRAVGDLTPDELNGPMLGFAETLRAEGRAGLIALAGVAEPRRWIDAEEVPLYGSAFPAGDAASLEALATIVGRHLRTRALVGLDELTARYPIDFATATDLLERLGDEGQLVSLGPDSEGREQWADRKNLEDVRLLSIALKRKEAVAVPPETFAAWLLRRHHAHPESCLQGEAAVVAVLERLRGFAASMEIWEGQILPRRVADYRPSWLDAAMASGGWRWRAVADDRHEPRLAIVPRDFAGSWPMRQEEETPLPTAEAKVLAELRERSAAFVDEIARTTGGEPSSVRNALRGLMKRGLAANDRLDPLRPGGDATSEALSRAATSPGGRPRLGSFRRPATDRPEGRWSAIAEDPPDAETSLLAWASALLDRHGVLTRETVALDPWAPPWRDLQAFLSRAELRGEIRRGYFVEGLSGVQYAAPEAAEDLARFAGSKVEDRSPVLLSTLDPANLYGSGAPLDVPLLEGGTARLPRSAGNFLAVISGRPVLIFEGFGKKITGLASASEAEIREALKLLPGLAGPGRRVLKVETYNTAAPTAGPAEPWLAEVGFVRDPPGMAYYAGW